MIKDLYMPTKGEKVVIQNDDLKFDGKNLIIPSYYSEIIYDYIQNWNVKNQKEADIEDYEQFKSFLFDVNEYTNQGN